MHCNIAFYTIVFDIELYSYFFGMYTAITNLTLLLGDLENAYGEVV